MRKAIYIFIVLSLILFTGCWDRKNIEDRGYILGIAIDSYYIKGEDGEKAKKEVQKFEHMDLSTSKPAYAMTIQMPLIKRSVSLSATGTGTSGGGGDEIKTWQLTQYGNSFISMEREMESRTSLTLNYEHLQAIILSDTVAKEGLNKVVDFFLRDREMRARIGLYIAEGSAKKLLEVIPNVQDHSATYLSQLPENSQMTSRIAYNQDLGQVRNNIRIGEDFVLPKVEATKHEIKINGGALIKSGKMVGWIDELDVESINFILNLYRGGIIVAEVPGEKSGLIAMDVVKSKAKIKPVIHDDTVRFDISIKAKGDYAEETGLSTQAKINEGYLKECEKALAKVIEERCNITAGKLQKKYNVDAFKLKKILQAEEPAYWERMKHQWDSIYPDVEINIKAEVELQLLGNMK